MKKVLKVLMMLVTCVAAAAFASDNACSRHVTLYVTGGGKMIISHHGINSLRRSDFPSEYVRLEYIHNDSSAAHIIAQISPIVNTDVTFGSVFIRDYDDYQQDRSDNVPLAFKETNTFEMTVYTKGVVWCRIWNAYTNTDTFAYINGKKDVIYGRNDNFGKITKGVIGRLEILNNVLTFRISETQIKTASNIPYAQCTVNYVNLFGSFEINSSNNAIKSLIGRLYEVYAKSGDNYLVHFVPVKRKNDNALGFYEMVSGQFFTNANYQANFTAGPAV